MPISDCQLFASHRNKNRQSEIGNPRLSEFVFVLVFVDLLFDNVQLDGIESNNFQVSSTFFARHNFALVRVQINVDISIAFRASSGRHSFILPALCEAGYTPSRESTSTCKQPNQSTRQRWNLQQSFFSKNGPGFITFLCRNGFVPKVLKLLLGRLWGEELFSREGAKVQ